jgi:hypothetical protein
MYVQERFFDALCMKQGFKGLMFLGNIKGGFILRTRFIHFIMLLAILIIAGNCDTAITGKKKNNDTLFKLILLSGKPITIDPGEVTLAPQETQKFTVKTEDPDCSSVTWSVVEAEGGTIDQEGNYTAPLIVPLEDPIHVTATCDGDSKKYDTAKVHIYSSGGPSVEPDYSGTVTIEVNGMGTRYLYSSFNHDATFTVNLHFYDVGSTDTVLVWFNYTTSLQPIEVSGSFYEYIAPPKVDPVTITSNGQQSFSTSTSAVLISIDTNKKTLYISVSGVTFNNCLTLPGGKTTTGIIEDAHVTVPLPVDLSHLTGVEKSETYAQYPATLSWNLTRTH